MSVDPNALTDRERTAVEAELRMLADDQFVLAERYVDWQVRGPTLEADVALANVAQDEYGHARLWYGLLERLGYEERELLWERDPAEFRHATLVELAVEPGDWADCLLRAYLYDVFESLHLDALVDTSYPPIAGRIEAVAGEETYHREHAESWLARLAAGAGPGDEPLDRLESALDRLYPHALTLFAPTDHEQAILDTGVRTVPIDRLRAAWRGETTPFLEGLGLTVPEPSLPEACGRDGSHTDDWRALYDEFRFTYEQLGHEPATLMEPPGGVAE